MSNCPFLSTEDEKINCFNECGFHEYEKDGGCCPFRKAKNSKDINVKEIITFDLDYSREEDKKFIERIYVKNYY
ncbi:hypothetical protein [Clostridium oryzae]|uniref:Uncharacterized protein n=1 Tax=Clostridium oryzae TaxID=1450648 RepID=A0A1V4INV9_9CLOT|nr:hypothetical protein [Clostridium oryzae]OPJ61167.1 hypothetical protein CLORY_23790 [Clostridium oryzae]